MVQTSAQHFARSETSSEYTSTSAVSKMRHPARHGSRAGRMFVPYAVVRCLQGWKASKNSRRDWYHYRGLGGCRRT